MMWYVHYVKSVKEKRMELFNAGHIDNQQSRIWLMSDIHLGCRNWAKDILMKDIEAIKKDPFARVVINGDTLQKDLRTSVGDVYGQSVRPGEQKYEAEKILKDIADKIVGISEGNHDGGVRIKEDSTDIKDLCRFLGVHYFQDEISFRISTGTDKYGNPNVKTFYGVHGISSAQTIGAIMNSLFRLSNVCDADVYFMGHTHWTGQFPAGFFRRDIIHEKMIPVARLFVSSAAYQGREQYPVVHAMVPKTMGTPIVTIDSEQNKVTVECPTSMFA